MCMYSRTCTCRYSHVRVHVLVGTDTSCTCTGTTCSTTVLVPVLKHRHTPVHFQVSKAPFVNLLYLGTVESLNQYPPLELWNRFILTRTPPKVFIYIFIRAGPPHQYGNTSRYVDPSLSHIFVRRESRVESQFYLDACRALEAPQTCSGPLAMTPGCGFKIYTDNHCQFIISLWMINSTRREPRGTQQVLVGTSATKYLFCFHKIKIHNFRK